MTGEPLFAALMFPALFLLIFLGVPVSFSLITVAFAFGWLVFGDLTPLQLYRFIVSTASIHVLVAVPLFVFMGAMLERSGIAERLFEAMRLWLGRLPGGLSLATISMCAIFAAGTGIVGAVEALVGLMAIPAMLRYGYDKGLISGTICAGGSLGTIIPPSIVVVIYASTAQLSIGELFAGILIPGLAMVAFFLIYIVLRCVLRPQDGPRLPEDEARVPLGRKLTITVTALVPALLLVFAVVGSIMLGIASPTEAAAVGAAGTIVLAVAYRRFTVGRFVEALRTTIGINAMILLIVVGGTMFTSIFIVSGGDDLVASLVEALRLGPTGMIALFLLIIFLLGFVLDWVSAVLICIPIFNPLLAAAGVDALWFAVMAVVVIQTAYLTPPMAPAIFYLRAIAPPHITYGDMYRGVVPFVACQGLTLVTVMAWPQAATYLPSLVRGF